MVNVFSEISTEFQFYASFTCWVFGAFPNIGWHARAVTHNLKEVIKYLVKLEQNRLVLIFAFQIKNRLFYNTHGVSFPLVEDG